jgi:hypothetical protein
LLLHGGVIFILCFSQAQRGAIAEGVPQECQIVVQELPPQERMPEELSTIQPQEEPEMRVVPHVEEMTSPKRLIFFM